MKLHEITLKLYNLHKTLHSNYISLLFEKKIRHQEKFQLPPSRQITNPYFEESENKLWLTITHHKVLHVHLWHDVFAQLLKICKTVRSWFDISLKSEWANAQLSKAYRLPKHTLGNIVPPTNQHLQTALLLRFLTHAGLLTWTGGLVRFPNPLAPSRCMSVGELD